MELHSWRYAFPLTNRVLWRLVRSQARTRRSLRQGAQYHNYRDDYFARIGVARNAADAKSNRRLQGQKQRFSGRCLPEVWQNSFWQRFAWQDGRVLSGVSL